MLRHLRLRNAAGKETALTVRGRRVDPRKLQQYLRRAPHVLERYEKGDMPSVEAAGEVDARSPSPPPAPVLRSPGPAHDVEEMLFTVRACINGSFDTGTWYYDQNGYCWSRRGNRGHDLLVTMYESFEMVLDCMNRGEPVDLLAILAPSFESVKTILDEQTPQLLSYFLYISQRLHVQGHPRLLAQFLEYGQALTPEVLGAAHPLNRFWRLLPSTFKMNHEGMEQLFYLSTDDLARRINTSNRFLLLTCRDFVDSSWDWMDLERQEAYVRRQIDRISPASRTDPMFVELQMRYAHVVCELCCARKDYPAAIQAITSLAGSDTLGPWAKARQSYRLSFVKFQMGLLDESEQHIQEALRISRQHGRYLNLETTRYLLSLEKILVRAGRNDEAMQISRTRSVGLRVFEMQCGARADASTIVSEVGSPSFSSDELMELSWPTRCGLSTRRPESPWSNYLQSRHGTRESTTERLIWRPGRSVQADSQVQADEKFILVDAGGGTCDLLSDGQHATQDQLSNAPSLQEAGGTLRSDDDDDPISPSWRRYILGPLVKAPRPPPRARYAQDVRVEVSRPTSGIVSYYIL